MLLVDHASRLEGLLLNAFPVEQDGFAPAEMNVGWGQVARALVAAAVVAAMSVGSQRGRRDAGAVLRERLPALCEAAAHLSAAG